MSITETEALIATTGIMGDSALEVEAGLAAYSKDAATATLLQMSRDAIEGILKARELATMLPGYLRRRVPRGASAELDVLIARLESLQATPPAGKMIDFARMPTIPARMVAVGREWRHGCTFCKREGGTRNEDHRGNVGSHAAGGNTSNDNGGALVSPAVMIVSELP